MPWRRRRSGMRARSRGSRARRPWRQRPTSAKMGVVAMMRVRRPASTCSATAEGREGRCRKLEATGDGDEGQCRSREADHPSAQGEIAAEETTIESMSTDSVSISDRAADRELDQRRLHAPERADQRGVRGSARRAWSRPALMFPWILAGSLLLTRGAAPRLAACSALFRGKSKHARWPRGLVSPR